MVPPKLLFCFPKIRSLPTTSAHFCCCIIEKPQNYFLTLVPGVQGVLTHTVNQKLALE